MFDFVFLTLSSAQSYAIEPKWLKLLYDTKIYVNEKTPIIINVCAWVNNYGSVSKLSRTKFYRIKCGELVNSSQSLLRRINSNSLFSWSSLIYILCSMLLIKMIMKWETSHPYYLKIYIWDTLHMWYRRILYSIFFWIVWESA